MLTLTQAKESMKQLGRRGLEQLISQYDEDVIAAAFDCDIQASDIEECYQGHWNSDEEFVQNLLEDSGTLPKDLPSYIHIDWTRTASDVMMDYSASGGYYFRNL